MIIKSPPFSTVGIIGGGPSGVAAIKALLGEKSFSKIKAFEQQSNAGGVW